MANHDAGKHRTTADKHAAIADIHDIVLIADKEANKKAAHLAAQQVKVAADNYKIGQGQRSSQSTATSSDNKSSQLVASC